MHLKYFSLNVMCNNKKPKTTVIKDQLRNIIGNILCAIVYLTSKETSQTAAMPMDFASVDDHVRETTQEALSEILKKKL